jgi:hypothetical protein
MEIDASVPETGRITWDSEGAEGGRFHSRVLHVPTATSGLTIGRGYDMKLKKPTQILADLMKAGVSQADAEKVSRAAGLEGDLARKFIKENDLQNFEISPSTQKTLFRITYEAEASEAKRISTKEDVRKKYGDCDWDQLDPVVRDLVVDLKFRGDYTPVSRARIQRLIARNDVEGLARDVGSSANWPNVPRDRFERRKKALEEAAAKRKATVKPPVAS